MSRHAQFRENFVTSHSKRIKMRFLLYIITAIVVGGGIVGCRRGPEEDVRHGLNPHLKALLSDSAACNPYAYATKDAPDDGCERLKINPIGPSLSRAFNDSNYRHLEYARAGGMKPFHDSRSAWENGKGLVRATSNEFIYIDTLTHSYAYLRPHARDLLEEIGQRFADSLYSRGGGGYRLKVTSLLRSDITVGRLRRVNRNATSESAHIYGTTFDISYSKFICDDPSKPHRTFEDLKNLLAEVVYALRQEGRLLAKIERHQACIHITAAPPSQNRKADEKNSN